MPRFQNRWQFILRVNYNHSSGYEEQQLVYEYFFDEDANYEEGPVGFDKQTLAVDAADTTIAKIWGSYNDIIYDVTDYVYSLGLTQNSSTFEFLDSDLVAAFKQRSGQDVTKPLNAVLDSMNSTYRAQHMACLNNAFLARSVTSVDFRKTPRCQVQNWLLLFFSALLLASIALKCLSSVDIQIFFFLELKSYYNEQNILYTISTRYYHCCGKIVGSVLVSKKVKKKGRVY